MSRLGIIAAFPGELRPLAAGWRAVTHSRRDSGQVAWQGVIGSTECIAVAAGAGREAAIRACGLAESLGPLDGLISFGWAGAISCGMQGGKAYVVAEVIDARTGQQFATSPPARSGMPPGLPLKLVTIDHVAQAEEKRALAQRYHAVLVDMEAAMVASISRQKRIAFYCLKAVSDTPIDRLPDFSRFIDYQGGLRMPALVAHLALRPKYWRSIARMRKNSKAGAEAVAQALRELVETHASHAGR